MWCDERLGSTIYLSTQHTFSLSFETFNKFLYFSLIFFNKNLVIIFVFLKRRNTHTHAASDLIKIKQRSQQNIFKILIRKTHSREFIALYINLDLISKFVHPPFPSQSNRI